MDLAGTIKRLVGWSRVEETAATGNGEIAPEIVTAPPAGNTDDLPADEPPLPVVNSLEEKQQLLAHFVRLVARKVSHGLFVAGVGGTGKSRTIAETLAAEGVCPILLNSHITPLSLFMTLYEFREDKIIWLDDCDAIFPNLRILGILRSALWGQGERIVSYSSTQLAGVPNSFVFNSRLICCANTLPSTRNEAFQAVLSRIDVFRLDATNDEILELMRNLAGKGFGTLSPEVCREVVDFIARAGGSRQLSMRLYEPSLRKVEYALENNVNWQELVRCQLDQISQKSNAPQATSKEFLLACIAQAVAAHPESVKGQEDFWCERTGKSRATFFRIKRVYEAENKPERQQ